MHDIDLHLYSFSLVYANIAYTELDRKLIYRALHCEMVNRAGVSNVYHPHRFSGVFGE